MEGGCIFRDPLALRILGPEGTAAVAEAARHPERRRLRLFIAIRSSLAEAFLAEAHGEGFRQLVVLGAGLDTFAYRNPLGEGLRMFEVDHPATQAWKQERLAAAAIPVPPNLTFAPVDFEQESLAPALEKAGFDPAQPAFFTWLGVVPYLTEEAMVSTLEALVRLPGGARVVFDYGNPPLASGTDAYTRAQGELAARVAAVGEAFHSRFDTPGLHARMAGQGWRILRDLGPEALRERFAPGQGAGPGPGGHVLLAGTR
jgi:methyltransferase (TIGR00027 family)